MLEALQVHDEYVRQGPNRQLLGGIDVLLALSAVPLERARGKVVRIVLNAMNECVHGAMSEPDSSR